MRGSLGAEIVRGAEIGARKLARVPRPRVDYDVHGRTYARHRRPDPRLAARIHAALGDARTVVDVGAGTGSYEPRDRWVLAVEPSATMRAQRPAGAAPAIDARAEALPLDEDAVDAAMACLTIHHREPPEAGLAEMRRVARGPVVVFTLDLDGHASWQQEFLAEGLALDRRRFLSWRRPEALLDPEVRASQSVWALLPPGVEERIVGRLAAALDSGAWDAEHGRLREQDRHDGALRLVVSEPG